MLQENEDFFTKLKNQKVLKEAKRAKNKYYFNKYKKML
jgi:hypothetical protein